MTEARPNWPPGPAVLILRVDMGTLPFDTESVQGTNTGFSSHHQRCVNSGHFDSSAPQTFDAHLSGASDFYPDGQNTIELELKLQTHT